MPKIRLVCAMALPLGMLLGSVGAASAQATQAARDACTPDAMRLCKEFIPDQAKVRSCMLSKQSQLSEACRLAMAAAKPVESASSASSEPRRRHYDHHRRYHRYRDCCC
jgi:hypothetical protein